MTADASRRSPRTRPSMADVGRAADVSAQTVSRYFTGSGYVSTATRARIEAAIESLGYRHNRVARNLRVNRTDTVGVLTMGQLNYGNSSILSGLSAAARSAGFSLVISQLDVDSDVGDPATEVHRALDHFLSFQVDGIVVTTPYLGTAALLDHIWETVPVLAISARPWSGADTATADSYGAGLLATRHLLERGHRRILHVAGPTNRNETVERIRGYRDAMIAAGIEPLEVRHGQEWAAAAGAAIGSEVDPTDFTAVFAANDQLALGFMHAMRARGLRPPHDYSIVGVDDMPDAQFFSPPLSTIKLDFTQLGTASFEMIHRRILSGERQEPILVPPVLIARESSGPVGDH